MLFRSLITYVYNFFVKFGSQRYEIIGSQQKTPEFFRGLTFLTRALGPCL